MATLDDVEQARLEYERLKTEAKDALEEEIKEAQKRVDELQKKYAELYGATKKRRTRRTKAQIEADNAVKPKATKEPKAKKPNARKPKAKKA